MLKISPSHIVRIPRIQGMIFTIQDINNENRFFHQKMTDSDRNNFIKTRDKLIIKIIV